MSDRLRFWLNRLGERLWIRPLAMCLFSVLAVLAASFADRFDLAGVVPEVTHETVEALLQVLSASMLVIATFAVGSMVSSYASAGGTATPRAFSLIVSDDNSQNALSIFVGAFIYSIVGIVALENGLYQTAARFTLFVLTLLVFTTVIVTFVRWVDCIARLGRVGTTIEKVEAATAEAIRQRLGDPQLGGIDAALELRGTPVFSETIGYVQRVDIEILQEAAHEHDATIALAALPGTFTAPDRPLVHVEGEVPRERICEAFLIGKNRTYEEDPRFGLVVLGEIAARALSPSVNDPGTAIDVIGSLVRLFTRWDEGPESRERPRFDRVSVPQLRIDDLFDDAFTAIARDGADSVEVAVRLQKALRSLATLDSPQIKAAAERHARLALARATDALRMPQDLEAVEAACLVTPDSDEHRLGFERRG